MTNSARFIQNERLAAGTAFDPDYGKVIPVDPDLTLEQIPFDAFRSCSKEITAVRSDGLFVDQAFSCPFGWLTWYFRSVEYSSTVSARPLVVLDEFGEYSPLANSAARRDGAAVLSGFCSARIEERNHSHSCSEADTRAADCETHSGLLNLRRTARRPGTCS